MLRHALGVIDEGTESSRPDEASPDLLFLRSQRHERYGEAVRFPTTTVGGVDAIR